MRSEHLGTDAQDQASGNPAGCESFAYVLPADAVSLAVVLVQLPLENIEMRGRRVGSTARSLRKRASVQERRCVVYAGVSELEVGMT